jgi:hypothetical protein
VSLYLTVPLLVVLLVLLSSRRQRLVVLVGLLSSHCRNSE